MAHDMGKLAGFHFHDTKVAAKLDAFGVLEEFQADFSEFKPEAVAIDRQVLKHHHVIGSAYVPTFSLGFVKTLFNDPEVRQLIWDGENFKMRNAEKLLRKLLQFAIFDLAGGSVDGNLNNTNLELLFATHDRILGELRQAANPEALSTRLEEIAATQTEERIATTLMFMDDNLDNRAPGYHLDIMRKAVSEAIAAGTISEADWQIALQNAHHLTQTQYFIGDRLSQMNEDGQCRDFVNGAELGWVNPAFLKFQAVRGRVAQWAYAETGKDLDMSFIGSDGRELFSSEFEAKLNTILLAADAKPVFEGRTAYLADGAGNRIEAIKINLVDGQTPDRARIQVQLLNI
jgi:hypothetical protein